MSVYFIQRGKDGPIKIGVAENFFTRYKAELEAQEALLRKRKEVGHG